MSKPVFKYVNFAVVKASSTMELAALPMQICEPRNPERVIRFLASDDTIDRANEVILPEGWDLTEWMQNPVIMQFHDYSMWPLGRGVAAGIVDGALMIDVEFDPPEVDESADLVFRKVCHGSVKAGSVGFTPVEWVHPGSSKGIELFAKYPGATCIYTKQSLLEFTICPIPCNPSAVSQSMLKMYNKNLGLDAQSESDTAASLSGDRFDAVALKIAEMRLNQTC